MFHFCCLVFFSEEKYFLIKLKIELKFWLKIQFTLEFSELFSKLIIILSDCSMHKVVCSEVENREKREKKKNVYVLYKWFKHFDRKAANSTHTSTHTICRHEWLDECEVNSAFPLAKTENKIGATHLLVRCVFDEMRPTKTHYTYEKYVEKTHF